MAALETTAPSDPSKTSDDNVDVDSVCKKTNGTQNGNNDLKPENSSNQVASIPDQLMLPYDELMDFIFAAEELPMNTSQGVAQTHLDMLSTAWSEFKAAFQVERVAKRMYGFNYNMILQKYMTVSGKLNDLMKNTNVSQNASNVQFSLPKIKLPEFHGKSTEWKAFISLFNRMVHNNPKADDGMKIEW